MKPDFKTEDVWAVAKALIETALEHHDGDYFIGYECRCCGERMNTPYRNGVCQHGDPDKLQHKADCQVLAARDLLTGAPVSL